MNGSNRAMVLALAALIFTGQGAFGQSLKLGDDAPKLIISDWVKGDPIDVGKEKGKRAVFVEFWATWCPPCIESIPHLTEMQRKHKKDLVVLGIASPGKGETLTKVKRFVRARGDAMSYTIAYDGARKTVDAYMGAVGAYGLPWAFLVDKNGKLVWHGHPLDPTVPEIVDQVVKGTYDASYAVLQEKLMPMYQRLNRLQQAGEWEGFKSMAKTILGLDPQNDSAMGAMIYACLFETDDEAGLKEWVESHIAANRTNSKALTTLAISLMSISDLENRKPVLALNAAKAAYDACEGTDCVTLDTYARALFEIGLVDRAIDLQTKAIAMVNGDDARRAAMEKVADFYRVCKSLQAEQVQ